MRGEVVNLKVYQRVVDEYEVMRKWGAVGLSEPILYGLRNKGVHLIRIVKVSKVEPTKIYYTTVNRFINSDLKFLNGETDFQRFVKFVDMECQDYTTQKRLLS